MSLDHILREGATASFEAAVTVDGVSSIVYYSDWEYSSPTPQKRINIEDLEITEYQSVNSIPWPGEGLWRQATVIWADGISQKIYFKNNIAHWGGGLCNQNGGEQGDSLKRLASPQMKQFLATYIEEMQIQLPNIPAFYNRFLLAGFEIYEQAENQIIICATLKDPDSRMAQLFNWRIAGSDPEEEPAWRTEIRADIGLESLFPNE